MKLGKERKVAEKARKAYERQEKNARKERIAT